MKVTEQLPKYPTPMPYSAHNPPPRDPGDIVIRLEARCSQCAHCYPPEPAPKAKAKAPVRKKARP